jgi:hypothetical protein
VAARGTCEIAIGREQGKRGRQREREIQRIEGAECAGPYGGDPVVLFDRPGKGEYDPAYSKNGRYVVFSGAE